MFGRWTKSAERESSALGAERLLHVLREELPNADDETLRVVAAIAGLLGSVAYADRDFKESEEQRIRRELARVHGMTEPGIHAICRVLREHIVEVSTLQTPRYSRVLLELGDHELRLQILELLLEIAAADGRIQNVETNSLRQITTSLGLAQEDYNALQEKHRSLLSVMS